MLMYAFLYQTGVYPSLARIRDYPTHSRVGLDVRVCGRVLAQVVPDFAAGGEGSESRQKNEAGGAGS